MAARLTTYLVVAIVSATLIAGLILGAQRNDSDGPIDLIVHHASVYTTESGDTAEAVAIRGNQVLRVGSNRDIMRLQRPQTVMVDARGGAVLPGFNDADAQPIAGGLALDAIDLAGAADLSEVQARIRNWIEVNPDRPWVVARGWDPAVVLPGNGARQWLDAAVPDKPAALMAADGSAAWVNSRALPARDAAGVLRGADLARLQAALPRPSRTARAAGLRAAITEAHRLGITSLQHLGASAEDLELYADAQRDGDLGVRVYGAIPLDGGATEAEVARLDGLANKFPDDPLFKLGAVVLSAGETSADDLNRLVRLLDARGWQVVVRAQDEGAVRLALDAFDHAARSNPQPARGRRHRIEGVHGIGPDDLPRLKALGVVVSMASIEGVSATASAGARVVLGSHWPLGDLNPMPGLGSAVNVAEKFTIRRAIDALTSAAAYASFDEHRKGTLKSGMLADLVILSDNVFSIPAERLATVEVAATVFDGRVVYQREKKTTP